METIKGYILDSWNSLQWAFEKICAKLSLFVPHMTIAILVLIVGSYVAIFLSGLVGSVIKKGKIDKALDSALSPVSKLIGTKISSGTLIEETVKWVLLATVVFASLDLARMGRIFDFLIRGVSYSKHIFIAVITMVIATLLASLVAGVTSVITRGDRRHKYLSRTSRFLILAFAGVTALQIVMSPLSSTISGFVNGFAGSTFKSDALFVGLVVLFVYGFRNIATKWIESIFED